MEGKPVHVAASGRTDAGVHALAQVAAISIENPIPTDNFRRAVNRLLPGSVRIFDVAETHAEFHPRFDAVRKTYEYRAFREEVCPPFLRQYVYHHPYPLDEAAMIEAAGHLAGEHDFAAFAASDERDAVSGSKVRTLFRSTLERQEHLLLYRVTGSGFLKHMVRNIVGVLLEIGKRNVNLSGLVTRLQPNCNISPGPTAPARGLFLISVEYD
jgi:tRNA pseudouridine38-40 synthase